MAREEQIEENEKTAVAADDPLTKRIIGEGERGTMAQVAEEERVVAEATEAEMKQVTEDERVERSTAPDMTFEGGGGAGGEVKAQVAADEVEFQAAGGATGGVVAVVEVEAAEEGGVKSDQPGLQEQHAFPEQSSQHLPEQLERIVPKGRCE